MKDTRLALRAVLVLAAVTSVPAVVSGQSIPVPVGVCVANCAPVGGGSGVDPAAAAAAAAAEKERFETAQRLGREAFDKGEAALGRGDVKAALSFYRSALQFAPDNIVYRRKRAATLKAHAGGALDELRGAAIDGEAAAGTQGDAAAGMSQRSFDVGGSRPPPAAAFVADDDVPALLGRMMDLPLDLREPANAEVRKAMAQVEYMLKYNREARIREAWPENVAKFEEAVTDLNKTLAARGVAEVPVEKVEAVYGKHLLDVKEKKL